MNEHRLTTSNRALVRYFRARTWAQSEAAHDEIARLISQPAHQVDAGLTRVQAALVRAGAAAAASEPERMRRVLGDAFKRLAAESPKASG